MLTINKTTVVCFDVDGTLIREWSEKDNSFVKQNPFCRPAEVHFNHPLHMGESCSRIPMYKNIQLLRDMYARGRCIVVWSAAGYQWAEAVVKALDLEACVDFIIEKPIAYVDDLEAHEILGQRIFLHD